MRIKISPTVALIANRENTLSLFLIEIILRSFKRKRTSIRKLHSVLSKYVKKRTADKYIKEAIDNKIVYSDGNSIRLRDTESLKIDYYKYLQNEENKNANWFYKISSQELEIDLKVFLSGITNKASLRKASLSLIYFATNKKSNIVNTGKLAASQEAISNFLNITSRTLLNALADNSFIKTVDCIFEVRDFFDPQYHTELLNFIQYSKYKSSLLFRQSGCLEIRRPSAVVSKHKMKNGSRKYFIREVSCSSLTVPKKDSVATGLKSFGAKNKKGTLLSEEFPNRLTSPDNLYNPLSKTLLMPEKEAEYVFNFLLWISKAFSAKFGHRAGGKFWSIFTFSSYRRRLKAIIDDINFLGDDDEGSQYKEAIKILSRLYGRYRISDKKYRRNRHAVAAHATVESLSNPIVVKVNKHDFGFSEITFSKFFRKLVSNNPNVVFNNFFIEKRGYVKQMKKIPQVSVVSDENPWLEKLPYQNPRMGRLYANSHKRLRSEASPFYNQFYNMEVKGTKNLISQALILAKNYYDVNLIINPTEYAKVNDIIMKKRKELKRVRTLKLRILDKYRYGMSREEFLKDDPSKGHLTNYFYGPEKDAAMYK